MKKALFWLIFIILGVVSLGITSKSASAQAYLQERRMAQYAGSLQADQTPQPTASPFIVANGTTNSRALPPVGSNAGLVIGASVLVLIIIGGVLGSQRREKH